MAILSKVVLATAVGTGVAETLLRKQMKKDGDAMCGSAAAASIKCNKENDSIILDSLLDKCAKTKGDTNSACADACCVDATKAPDEDLCKRYSKTKTSFNKGNKVAVSKSSSFLQSSLPCSDTIASLAGKKASVVSGSDLQDILGKCCEEPAKDKSSSGLSPNSYR